MDFGLDQTDNVLKQLELMEKENSMSLGGGKKGLNVKGLKKGMTLNFSASPKVSSKEAQKERDGHKSRMKIKKGKSTGMSDDDQRKYSTVDFGFLSMYTDPNADNSISNEFKLKDDEAANLSSKLLSFFGSEESSSSNDPLILKQFAVKSDINEKGLQRGNKDKVEIKDSKKKGYQMEDESVCAYPFNNNMEMAVFGVFDGHAGCKAAKAAKEFVPEELALVWKEYTSGRFDSKASSSRSSSSSSSKPQKVVEDAKDLFINVFDRVDLAMDKLYQYEGCTATVACVWSGNGKRFLQVANVGDSTAFFSKGNDGETMMISRDHKVSNPEEVVRLKKLGVEVNDSQTRLNGLSICRTLGDCFLKNNGSGVVSDPYVSEPIILTSSGGTLIIASDGLWDVISGKKAMDIIKNVNTAEEKATKLLNTALSSPKCQDNVTVIVVLL